MKLMTTFTSLPLLFMMATGGGALAADTSSKSQTILRAGSQPSVKNPADYFTGSVYYDPLFPSSDSTPVSAVSVSFDPSTRSAWHTHPAGQHLIVTSGVGWTQQWGGPILEIRAGDVVICPPDIKHWHGATPTTRMTHIAITGVRAGKNVEWMEKVSDEQYKAGTQK